jgi:hypothetical protein
MSNFAKKQQLSKQNFEKIVNNSEISKFNDDSIQRYDSDVT